jgi:hypothetical protein
MTKKVNFNFYLESRFNKEKVLIITQISPSIKNINTEINANCIESKDNPFIYQYFVKRPEALFESIFKHPFNKLIKL